VSILPQYERALVEAAARRQVAAPRRRRVAWAGAHRAVLAAAAAVACAVVLAGAALLGARDPADRPAHSSALRAPGLVTLLKSKALTREPEVLPAGRTRRPTGLTPATFAASIDRLLATLPYPPGRADTRLRTVAHLPVTKTDMSGITALEDARMLAEFRAWCIWQVYWRDARATGAAAAQAAAAQVLGDAARWPTLRRTSAGGWARTVAADARAGDLAAVRANIGRDCANL
jgi:hypothetical protein